MRYTCSHYGRRCTCKQKEWKGNGCCRSCVRSYSACTSDHSHISRKNIPRYARVLVLSRRMSATIAASILMAVLAALVFKQQIAELASAFSECAFHKLTGLLCPACGNTRSVICLLKGDIVPSVGYNAVIPIGAALLCLFWLQCFFSTFGIKVRLLPKSQIFWVGLLCAVLLFLLMRNFFRFLSPCCYTD